MLNETTENFLRVMAEFQWPDPVPVSYRLYYNDDGSPQCYTMENLPGKYIEVDKETYLNNCWHVKVVEDKLILLPKKISVHKLKPNPTQGVLCDLRDVCVIVDAVQTHVKWNLTNNETY